MLVGMVSNDSIDSVRDISESVKRRALDRYAGLALEAGSAMAMRGIPVSTAHVQWLDAAGATTFNDAAAEVYSAVLKANSAEPVKDVGARMSRLALLLDELLRGLGAALITARDGRTSTILAALSQHWQIDTTEKAIEERCRTYRAELQLAVRTAASASSAGANVYNVEAHGSAVQFGDHASASVGNVSRVC